MSARRTFGCSDRSFFPVLTNLKSEVCLFRRTKPDSGCSFHHKPEEQRQILSKIGSVIGPYDYGAFLDAIFLVSPELVEYLGGRTCDSDRGGRFLILREEDPGRTIGKRGVGRASGSSRTRFYRP
jgi:hypothetical protein